MGVATSVLLVHAIDQCGDGEVNYANAGYFAAVVEDLWIRLLHNAVGTVENPRSLVIRTTAVDGCLTVLKAFMECLGSSRGGLNVLSGRSRGSSRVTGVVLASHSEDSIIPYSVNGADHDHDYHPHVHHGGIVGLKLLNDLCHRFIEDFLLLETLPASGMSSLQVETIVFILLYAIQYRVYLITYHIYWI